MCVRVSIYVVIFFFRCSLTIIICRCLCIVFVVVVIVERRYKVGGENDVRRVMIEMTRQVDYWAWIRSVPLARYNKGHHVCSFMSLMLVHVGIGSVMYAKWWRIIFRFNVTALLMIMQSYAPHIQIQRKRTNSSLPSKCQSIRAIRARWAHRQVIMFMFAWFTIFR